MKIRFLRSMRNALVIVIVCLSVSLLYDVYKEPIDRLLHLDQTETNETTETGNRKQKTKKQAQKPDGQQEEGLPSAYDGRMTGKAPEVKNQGTFGTCWAVVTSSALESRLLPQEDIIFSADHISTQNSYAIGQEEGGAYNIAIAYLTAWQGPVTEEMDPYGDGVTPEGLSPVKHVQEVQIAEDKDFDAIKEMIYRYGAVQSSIYMDMGGTKVTSEYYDPENTSYYYNGEDEVNHDILIIGWDDDYPAENFTKTPSKNGAFCVRTAGAKALATAEDFMLPMMIHRLAETVWHTQGLTGQITMTIFIRPICVAGSEIWAIKKKAAGLQTFIRQIVHRRCVQSGFMQPGRSRITKSMWRQILKTRCHLFCQRRSRKVIWNEKDFIRLI